MPEERRIALPILGLLVALAGFVALQTRAYLGAGVFEYPLDDVYIHLSMASQILQGGYGVNAGEPASAASSILYPLLLLPFPGTEFQRLLPLFWNVLAVAACGWVWGRIAVEARLTGIIAGVIVALAPICLNISGLGFTGMEAAPHLLASLLVVLGLWQSLTGRGVAPWFIAAAIAAPLLRYEGLALSLSAAAVLFVHGERRAAVMIAVGTLGCLAGFSLFLASLGLPPVPGSILAKTAAMNSSGGLIDRMAVMLIVNLMQPGGVLLGLLVLLAALLPVVFRPLRQGAPLWILLATAPAALAHLLVGQIGWLHRYEPYIVISLFAAILLASSALKAGALRIVEGVAALAVLGGGMVYLPSMWTRYVWNARAIHLQQAQMARFAVGYLKAPVAVNDLGRVSWTNPNYVLDLWGLGSDEARKIRLEGPPPPDGWAEPLVEKHGVKAAMIYDSWFKSAVGENWVKVAQLTMLPPKAALGSDTVTFYATDPGFAAEMRGELERFAPSLPDGAVLTILGAGA
ncbi:MAG: hypothetical protein ACRCS0_10785 [Albidovulum sp.]